MLTVRQSAPGRTEDVIGLAAGILRGRRLTIASNRGPFEFSHDKRGALHAERGSGGVVTALAALSRYVRIAWVASAMSDAERELGASPQQPAAFPGGFDMRLRFVVSPPAEYDLFYHTFSNPILWFVQHRLHHLLPQRDLAAVAIRAWHEGYRPVNRAFAIALARELRSGDASPVVMLHDYHLYLVARQLRHFVPQVFLQQFIHIPWPEPDAWAVLPEIVVGDLCRGLLANNIVGFQTRRSADNFLATCAEVLPDSRIDASHGTVALDGQQTFVRNYPISVDVDGLQTFAQSAEVAFYRRRLALLTREQTIVRVDRLDPSKNVLAGFHAFAALLERRPDLHRRVKFLSFLVPSRTAIPEYQRHARQVFDYIAAVNARFGHDGWQPIEVFFENNYAQSVAAMGMFDVLMINSKLDGMNLVSKEAAVLNRRDGVLILSRGAGSHEELGPSALSIDPHDVAGTTRALEVALAMPASERSRRAAAMRHTVEANDLTNWLYAQLDDIGFLAGPLSIPQR
ncbi:MAG: alpha,alpha-trehalose-phosphate synthase (UDP-forming), partial [Chloroflexota bacterium]